MEAKTAFRGSAVSRNMVAIVAAVLVAFVLGAVGGYVIRAFSPPVEAPAAGIATVHPPYAVGPGTRQSAGAGVAVAQNCRGVARIPGRIRPSAAADRSAADILNALRRSACGN